ncbi:GNAT family N-acetyltransferase [Iningainema tapete]|uniref:GNAT family N-acetyltransferase n=1 Tax=Iningainema tapete BLCC-T55 TaxID=2748662 RepID=A0A8J7BW01_9CYAN|nr:GNAT family N-acetyltransferase [Iningainema tapete]MBD2770882.1 GNAT family N-acetyltransferase [Iningainema tapete BLCC-T55]
MNTNFPPLETLRLYLKTLDQNDFEFFYRHFSNPQINRYILDEDPITSLEHAQEILNFYGQSTDKTYTRWVLVTKADGQPIGTCGFHKWSRRNYRAEIGYDLTPSAWRQGYMHEALSVMLEFGFQQMELNRVEALVYPENTASLRLLEKLHFQKEGLLRGYFW